MSVCNWERKGGYLFSPFFVSSNHFSYIVFDHAG